MTLFLDFPAFIRLAIRHPSRVIRMKICKQSPAPDLLVVAYVICRGNRIVPVDGRI